MQFEETQKLQRLKSYDIKCIQDLKRTGECLLHHATGIQFPSGLRINPVAIRRQLNEGRGYDYFNYVYDYEAEITHMLINQYRIEDVETEIDLPFCARKVMRYHIEELAIEAVQRIIDTNLIMFNKLNEYMANKNLLDQIEQM